MAATAPQVLAVRPVVVAGLAVVAVTGRAWAYVGAILGATVSIAANVAHSFVPPEQASPKWSPEPGAVIASTFWPVALLIAMEILSRIPWPTQGRWIAIRWGGLSPVAVVAAVVSYRHLSGLLGYYGEDDIVRAIGPLAVDGLMLIASGALLVPPAPAAEPLDDPVLDAVPVALALSGVSDTTPDRLPVETAAGLSDTTTDTSTDVSADTRTDGGPVPVRTRPVRKRGPGPSTAERIARLRDRDGDLSVSDIARRLKVTERTVHRHLAAARRDPVSDTTTDTTTTGPDPVDVDPIRLDVVTTETPAPVPALV